MDGVNPEPVRFSDVTLIGLIVFFCFLSFQALAGEGGYGEPRPPIFVERQPYYQAYPARIPLDYGIRRTYSGDYIGPGATNVSEEFSFLYYRAIKQP